ncbi:tRNA dimethylallyltransferase [Fibrobacterales bacterium]|nr:tRNA dimethylallyltransferase [Fibrobacterales bacterium]
MAIIGAIVGATGSGKTEFAVDLAAKMNAEIINMDSRQIYRDFCIGTSQPTFEEREKAVHHLVNFLPPEKSYNAAMFVSDVKNLLSQKTETNFILAGGTGLYMQALCEGLDILPPADPELRDRLRKHYAKLPVQTLYTDALKTKPSIEGKIMPNDKQRLLRVLELAEQGADKSEKIGERIGGIGAVPTMFLDIPREKLYGRINSRVKNMLENGWVEEVQKLAKSIPTHADNGTVIPAWQSLGYLELKAALDLKKDPFSIAEEVALKTRHYAKRQITWFKHHIDNNCPTPKINF